MQFHKYHGLGNNFILVDDRDGSVSKDPGWIRKVCDVNLGVGADGILYVQEPQEEENNFRMQIFNSDGSEAEMCGNGIRCFAKYVIDYGLIDATWLKIETQAGVILTSVEKGDDGKVEYVTVNMGKPELVGHKFETIALPDGTEIPITPISMGNPHAVIFAKKGMEEVERMGPLIEQHERFPNRTNVEFLDVLGEEEADLIVFERGCGITQACGTGTCASVFAGVLHGKFQVGKTVLVHLLGGDLWITVKEDMSSVIMKGPAVEVYSGELDEGAFQ
jgi:diaminopimelate epimerase